MIDEVEAGNRQVSRRATVNAPASEIFALISNPHMHHQIDGSGTVGANISGPDTLAVGDTFSTHMKQFGLAYKTTSTVTQSEENSVVEWKLGIGQKWRWELTPLSDSTTSVTETFDARDIPAVAAAVFKITGMFGRNAKGIESSLRKLQAHFEK